MISTIDPLTFTLFLKKILPLIFSIKFFAINIPKPIPFLVFVIYGSPNLSRISRPKPLPSSLILIDNSSRFRMDKNISLVIPEINFPKKLQNIYANPNCSTIILACLLEPLRKFKIKRVVVSTYQAASGAGIKGLDELNLHKYLKQ